MGRVRLEWVPRSEALWELAVVLQGELQTPTQLFSNFLRVVRGQLCQNDWQNLQHMISHGPSFW